MRARFEEGLALEYHLPILQSGEDATFEIEMGGCPNCCQIVHLQFVQDGLLETSLEFLGVRPWT